MWYDIKSLQKCHGICFVVASYSWVWCLPEVWLIQWDSTGENKFPHYKKVSVADSLLVRVGSPCPLSPLSAGYPSGLNLHRSGGWVLPQSMWVHVCINLTMWGRHCFLGVMHPAWLLDSFYLLFSIVPWGEGFDNDIHLGISAPKSPTPHIVWLRVTMFVPIYCEKMLL